MLCAHEIWTIHIELIRTVISFANEVFYFSVFCCVYTTDINSRYSLSHFLSKMLALSTNDGEKNSQ